MRTTKITVLVLLLVFALAAIGIGYAMWDKTLSIDGTVNTGDLDVHFIGATSTDGPGALDAPDYDKDVGQTVCEIDAVDDQLVLVTVSNVYPSYEALCNLKWENNGTIPVKLVSLGCPTAPDWLEVSIQDSIGAPLDAGGQETGELKFHVKQSAPQSEAATVFQCELLFSNWNEP